MQLILVTGDWRDVEGTDVSEHVLLLLIPRYRLRTFGRQAFAVAGATFWISPADELQTYSSDRFKLALKTFLFAT